MSQRITYILAVVFVFLLPWRQAIELPGGISIGPPVALILAIAWLGTIVTNREVRQPHPFHLAFGLYVGYIALSLVWSVNPAATIGRLIRTLYIFALLIIYWDLLRDHVRFETAMQALILGVIIIALSGIGTFVSGDLGGRRVVAHGVNANELARWVTLAAPLAAYLAVVSRRYSKGMWQYINLGYVIITPLAVGATVSRQGFVVLAALIGLAMFGVVRHWNDIWNMNLFKGVIAAISLSALIIALVLISPTVIIIERLSTFPSALATFGDRTPIWLAGIESLRANPIFGIGAGTYGEITPSDISADPHNTLLGVGVELGLIGLGIFLVTTLLPLREAFRQAASPLFAVAIYLSAGLYAVVAMLYTDPFNWLVLLFVLISYSFDNVRVLALTRDGLSTSSK